LGREATCEVRSGGKTSRGHARLEEKELLFKGDFRLKIPFAEMKTVEAKGGWLRLTHGGGTAELNLGDQAAPWAEKILKPKGRLEKLGLKDGQRVSILGLDEEKDFQAELSARGLDVSGRLRKDTDVVVVRMSAQADLRRLPALRDRIRKEGCVWVVWPKGRKELREDDVRREAVAIGLVDVKVMSFSDALSGLKLMIPRARR
jgi:hypothetical protein